MEPVFHYSIHPIFLHLFSHSCVIFLPLFGITHPTLRSTMHSARFFPCGIGIVPSKSHLVWCCRAVQAPWPSQRLPPAAGTDPVIHASRLSYLIFLFSSQSVSQILRTLFSYAIMRHSKRTLSTRWFFCSAVSCCSNWPLFFSSKHPSVHPRLPASTAVAI